MNQNNNLLSLEGRLLYNASKNFFVIQYKNGEHTTRFIQYSDVYANKNEIISIQLPNQDLVSKQRELDTLLYPLLSISFLDATKNTIALIKTQEGKTLYERPFTSFNT